MKLSLMTHLSLTRIHFRITYCSHNVSSPKTIHPITFDTAKSTVTKYFFEKKIVEKQNNN